jgi:hypothetical protein
MSNTFNSIIEACGTEYFILVLRLKGFGKFCESKNDVGISSICSSSTNETPPLVV